jgi:hypothetical protein
MTSAGEIVCSSFDVDEGDYTLTVTAIDSAGAKAAAAVWSLQAVAPPPQSSSAAKASATSTALVAVFAVLLLCGLLGVGITKRNTRQAQMKAFDFQTEINRMLETGELEFIDPAEFPAGPAGVATTAPGFPREIKRAHLCLIEEVGKGQFGSVFKATLDESSIGGSPEHLVAAKTVLDSTTSTEATRELRLEAMVMARLGSHPNVVSLVGVVTRGDPLVLIVSFCEHGSLLSLLRKRAARGDPLGTQLKLRMVLDVAAGMMHLESRKFVHRDLAARNVLVSSTIVAKVADFGLSREAVGATGGEYYKSQNGVFPIKWTAPEAMEHLRFSAKSDVWSFGIVVVEIFQDGEQPYKYTGLANPAIMLQVIGGSLVHAQPPATPDCIYSIICRCWSLDRAERPGFAELTAMLEAAAHDMPATVDDDVGAGGPELPVSLEASPFEQRGCGPGVSAGNVKQAQQLRRESSGVEFDEYGYVMDGRTSSTAAGLTNAVFQIPQDTGGYLVVDTMTAVSNTAPADGEVAGGCATAAGQPQHARTCQRPAPKGGTCKLTARGSGRFCAADTCPVLVCARSKSSASSDCSMHSGGDGSGGIYTSPSAAKTTVPPLNRNGIGKRSDRKASLYNGFEGESNL